MGQTKKQKKKKKISCQGICSIFISIEDRPIAIVTLNREKNERILHFDYNRDLNEMRRIICLRKSEVTIERIPVCYVIEKSMEHVKHYLPCFYTYDIIELLP